MAPKAIVATITPYPLFFIYKNLRGFERENNFENFVHKNFQLGVSSFRLNEKYDKTLIKTSKSLINVKDKKVNNSNKEMGKLLTFLLNWILYHLINLFRNIWKTNY